MIRTDYDAMHLFIQDGAFGHPMKGGDSVKVKAIKKMTKWKPIGTVSMATVKAMTEKGFLTWPKENNVLRIVATEAGREWYMSETLSRHA